MFGDEELASLAGLLPNCSRVTVAGSHLHNGRLSLTASGLAAAAVRLPLLVSVDLSYTGMDLAHVFHVVSHCHSMRELRCRGSRHGWGRDRDRDGKDAPPPMGPYERAMLHAMPAGPDAVIQLRRLLESVALEELTLTAAPTLFAPCPNHGM